MATTESKIARCYKCGHVFAETEGRILKNSGSRGIKAKCLKCFRSKS